MGRRQDLLLRKSSLERPNQSSTVLPSKGTQTKRTKKPPKGWLFIDITEQAIATKTPSSSMKPFYPRALMALLITLSPLLCRASDAVNGQSLRRATCQYIENEKRFPAVYSQVEDGKWRRAKYITGANSFIPETDYRVLKKDESSVYLVSDDSFSGVWGEVTQLDLKSSRCFYFENTEHKSSVNLNDPSLLRWDVELVEQSSSDAETAEGVATKNKQKEPQHNTPEPPESAEQKALPQAELDCMAARPADECRQMFERMQKAAYAEGATGRAAYDCFVANGTWVMKEGYMGCQK
jgi:hypothetical protein